MTEAPEDDGGIAVDQQRVIRKLRSELEEATFQKIALAALVDQLMEERQDRQGAPETPRETRA